MNPTQAELAGLAKLSTDQMEQWNAEYKPLEPGLSFPCQHYWHFTDGSIGYFERKTWEWKIHK